MAIYAVHNRVGGSPETAVFVREGFSSAAFLFGPLWALVNRMWLSAGVLIALGGATALASGVLGPVLSSVIGLAISAIFGCEARTLQARALAARGMPEVALTAGATEEEAELRYFSETGARLAVAAAVRQTPYVPPSDTLGIFGNV